MKSSIIDKIKNRIKKEDWRETELSMFVALKTHQILKENGKKQKDLAELLDKKESEVSKLLSGKQNFTIKTIALIETVLEENIIDTTLPKTGIQTILSYEAEVEAPTFADEVGDGWENLTRVELTVV